MRYFDVVRYLWHSKDKQLVKLEMVFFQSGYARVSKKLPGAKISQFKCAKEKMVYPNVEPKTIPFEVFQRIENIDRDYFTEEEQFHLDLFLFSFYAGGMGDMDVCYLTWDCIADDMLIYERMKTCKKAQMVLTDKAKNIINKYEKKSVLVLTIPKEKSIKYLSELEAW